MIPAQYWHQCDDSYSSDDWALSSPPVYPVLSHGMISLPSSSIRIGGNGCGWPDTGITGVSCAIQAPVLHTHSYLKKIQMSSHLPLSLNFYSSIPIRRSSLTRYTWRIFSFSCCWHDNRTEENQSMAMDQSGKAECLSDIRGFPRNKKHLICMPRKQPRVTRIIER